MDIEDAHEDDVFERLARQREAGRFNPAQVKRPGCRGRTASSSRCLDPDDFETYAQPPQATTTGRRRQPGQLASHDEPQSTRQAFTTSVVTDGQTAACATSESQSVGVPVSRLDDYDDDDDNDHDDDDDEEAPRQTGCSPKARSAVAHSLKSVKLPGMFGRSTGAFKKVRCDDDDETGADDDETGAADDETGAEGDDPAAPPPPFLNTALIRRGLSAFAAFAVLVLLSTTHAHSKPPAAKYAAALVRTTSPIELPPIDAWRAEKTEDLDKAQFFTPSLSPLPLSSPPPPPPSLTPRKTTASPPVASQSAACADAEPVRAWCLSRLFDNQCETDADVRRRCQLSCG
eukprot:6195142-Pleurochrysis_carterae.AAC.1